MSNDKSTEQIKRLQRAVEQAAGRKLTTPTDFATLANEIEQQSERRDTISISTLKRLWGYVKSQHSPSESVLSILSRYCGFRDWSHFIASTTSESGFLVMNPVSTAQLPAGTELQISWAPERTVRLVSRGNGDFEVVANHNSKLREGDVITLSVVCRGYPLYATNIRRGHSIIPAYVAAKESGILSVSVKKVQ